MALKITSEGEEFLLGLMLSGNLVLRLYENDITPGDSDTVATYQELSEAGYSPITLTGGSWTITHDGSEASGEYGEEDFILGTNITTGFDVYGYYITNTANDTVIWAERFSPIAEFDPGDDPAIRINPIITYSSIN